MACMYGRRGVVCGVGCGVCRRCVGVGVRCVWRWCTVLWRCVGTVYGAMALGVRMVSVCVRCVYRSMT